MTFTESNTVEPDGNQLTITNQWTYQAGAVAKRFDVVFPINGLPVVIGEAKTPTRSAVTWFDGVFQIHQVYQKEIPAIQELFDRAYGYIHQYY